ncbi:MAG: hypothetical protein ACPGRY_03950 [Candidatus Latescibacterota bacterium]
MSASGFPLRLVANHNPRAGLWRARRGEGECISSGTYRISNEPLVPPSVQLDEDAGAEAQLTARLCERAIHLILRRFSSSISESLWTALDGRRIRFMRNHDRLLDLGEEGLCISCEVASELGIEWDAKKDDLAAAQPELLNGFEVLLALGQFYLFSVLEQTPPRRALHDVLSLYDALSRSERLRVHQLLERPNIDSGNAFGLFLERAQSPHPDDMDGVTWRDLHITWLLGQDRLDLPYDRRAAREVLASDIDPDDKRLRLYEVLRSYDRDIEGDNIRRIAAEVRAQRQELVFGRMSRAFHNQGTLFADAALLFPDARMAELADALDKATRGSEVLQPTAEALRLLLKKGEEIALTQLEGACERFEEAVLEVQQQDTLAFLQRARERVENHGDELASTELPTVEDAHISQQTTARLRLVEDVRRAALAADKRNAAYVVVSQRPSPTGSHLLVKINEFEEPYLGKSENLKKLVRLSGNRVYSSPDYRWLEEADHWIEAIPLFIKEQVSTVDGREQTRTVVDIAGMEESFREEMADHWARNIRRVLEGEWISLAREWIAGDGVSDAAERASADEVLAIAALFAGLYERDSATIHHLVEREDIEPYAAMRHVLLERDHEAISHLNALREEGLALGDAALRAAAEADVPCDLTPWTARREDAFLPRPTLPTLHVLTTQSAGMTEGYIRTWLEESMALYNIVHTCDLQAQVEERQRFYAERIAQLGRQIVIELGIWVEVEELASREQLSEEAALRRVVGGNAQVQRELATLGVLVAHQEASDGRSGTELSEPALVEAYLQANGQALRNEVLDQVVARNGEPLQQAVDAYRSAHADTDSDGALRAVVEGDEAYRQDAETYARFAARQRVLEALDRDDPALCLRQRADSFLRRYGRLTKTTARKEIIAEHNLSHCTLYPQHYYQASGANKRYHLLYTPSRVDLGHRERESVETWSQWVGGADRAAARVGRRIYGLINKSVQSYESLTQPELLKTGENASMSSHFAFSNALSLMTTASGHGDIEEMGDQMSRRRDRLIHPAGEAYGGYCVPKDGLFLEFVLTLTRGEKLRQIGLPEDQHERAVRLAHDILARRDEYDTQFAWEQWAAEYLRQHIDGASSIFQLTRVANVLDGLGQPELRDPYRVMTSLAAHWGIHKMVAGGEHVNRFMPFFKTWLLRQAVVQAAQRHPALPIDSAHPVVVMAAEYKPDTQDGRFAAGMRKFEIMAGTGQHLLYSLDSEGQELAALTSEGFAALRARGRGERVLELLGVGASNADQVALDALFPAYASPAEMRIVSPTGLSTQDLLSYTSDTHLEEIAAEGENRLLASGFTEGEIEANMQVYGPDLMRWAHRAPIDEAIKRALGEELGGRLHALHLATVGPEYEFERALQGADVLDAGIPHRQLLDLLEDPALICDLMLEGNPNSALVIVDGASGARRRAMNRLDVMLFFAAGDNRQRESVYASIGLGGETIESWRATMRRRRRRAESLGTALCQGHLQEAERLYGEICEEIGQEQEVEQQLDEAAKLHRFGRDRPRDRHIAHLLAGIGRGLPLEELNFETFLALGGLFLLDGQSEQDIRAYREQFDASIAALSSRPTPDADRPLSGLLHVRFQPRVEEFREEKGIESSNKAAEESPAIAIEARHQLAERIALARALNERQSAFDAVDAAHISFDAAYSAAAATLGDGASALSEADFGTFCGHARTALLALASQLYDENNPGETQDFIERLSALFSTRQIEEENWRAIAGGYEDIGDLGRLAQRTVESAGLAQISEAERDRRLDMIARAGELFYSLLAVETTIAATHVAPEVRDTEALWTGLAVFFAETINDHFYPYRPWIFDRGIGFDHYDGEALYALANRHHAWLYRYLRTVVCTCTELAERPQREQDLLLGNGLYDAPIEAVGAGAESEAERLWRCYGQLRELAFMRNDGFPIPEVFEEFDPDLIDADGRVNHVFAVPVGRTHYSRALGEGPTLCRQLIDESRPGANLIISRHLKLVETEPHTAHIDSGHLYVDRTTYAQALIRCRGLSEAEAEQRATAVPPKGIRIAAAFTRPVLAALVYPFHGDPTYDDGRLEDCGLPYTIQSRFHTWTTYDKAKYPDIFPPSSGVDIPDEIDWLSRYGQRASEAQIKEWIEHGLEGTPYIGLAAFARQHRIVIVKDAAGSGGRGMSVFVLRRVDGSVDEDVLREAVDFTYQISLKNNVSIQEVVVSSPEYWANESFMRSFVDRQIVDWSSPVDRQRRPRTSIYGSHRIILSTDVPDAEADADKWHISHWITLNSKQLVTNVGRGGNLDLFLPEIVQESHRQALFAKLAQAGGRVMEALAAYEARTADLYREETGCEVGRDLTGVSYGNPRYMMLDFLVAPLFADSGELVDIRPQYDAQGQRIGAEYLLREGGRTFASAIIDWRIVLVEPNIGLGLWDRVALRETVVESQRAQEQQRPEDPDATGQQARIVLSDLSRAGEAYLDALEQAGVDRR